MFSNMLLIFAMTPFPTDTLLLMVLVFAPDDEMKSPRYFSDSTTFIGWPCTLRSGQNLFAFPMCNLCAAWSVKSQLFKLYVGVDKSIESNSFVPTGGKPKEVVHTGQGEDPDQALVQVLVDPPLLGHLPNLVY